MNFHDYFEYKNGHLFWKVSTNQKIKIGQKAGGGIRYESVKINKKSYLSHKVIFAMHYGYMPKEIDHVDCNKFNNKIENLREATREENQWNRKLQKNNKSGVKNVSFDTKTNKWKVQIRTNNIKKYIGVFKDLELAELVAIEARNKFHGNFAKH